MTIKIDKTNIQKFAEEMFKFNCANSYNNHCFSTSDIMREKTAYQITDLILEALDKAGFDMQSIQAFKEHEWNVEDLTSPNIENPILLFQSKMYETYLKNNDITKYFTEETGTITMLPA